MPLILLERLPLPSLKTYTALSVALLACSVYYAYQALDEDGAKSVAVFELLDYNINLTTSSDSVLEKAYLMAYVLYREPWCLVTLINTAYCCLILFGKLIQHIVFGHLRVAEEQHIKDKFWNFVFYKFIFIFGVMNVQEMEEIVLWCTWFSCLGFLHILAQLCKDRFEYLSFSPSTPLLTHTKVLLLLGGIHVTCLALLSFCIAVGYLYVGVNTFAFLAAEALLLIIKTLYVLVRYGIHLWDVYHDGVWENRAIYVYYSELLFEISALAIDFCHHLHMLLWGNIFLSMASLVICMQLRYLFHEFQRRFTRHQNYRKVVSSMQARFPMATSEELQQNCDDCAICWEKMETARKLPCGHIFHNACLRSWLEQDTTCPTCRTSLNDLHGFQNEPAGVNLVNGEPDELQTVRRRQRTTNRFHFDGSRYIRWLPSFSVEVTHMFGGYATHRQQAQTSQFDSMERQVRDMFPTIPRSVIIEDLRITNSAELTIDNILEGRLTVTPDFGVVNEPILDELDDVSDDDDDDDDIVVGQAAVVNDSNNSESLTTAAAATKTTTTTTAVFASNNRSSPVIPSVATPLIHADQPVASVNDGQKTSINEHIIAEDDTPMPFGAGSRFSKSSSERETMLALRKESMMDQARRRYMARESHQPGAASATATLPVENQSSSSSSEEIEQQQRRDLVYQAVQRRLNSSPASNSYIN